MSGTTAVTALWVALLGAVGSLSRWALSSAIARATGGRFPWGTLAVNLLGSVAIGAVLGLFAARGELDSRARVALTAGFLGGFTTYSSFAWETWTLLDRRAYALAVGYVLLTTAACIAGCALAIRLVR